MCACAYGTEKEKTKQFNYTVRAFERFIKQMSYFTRRWRQASHARNHRSFSTCHEKPISIEHLSSALRWVNENEMGSDRISVARGYCRDALLNYRLMARSNSSDDERSRRLKSANPMNSSLRGVSIASSGRQLTRSAMVCRSASTLSQSYEREREEKRRSLITARNISHQG